MANLPTIYTPQVMLEAMKQNPRPTTFLQKLLVGKRTAETSDIVEIDIEKGGRRISSYVTRTANPSAVGKNGFTTNLHNTPYISEEITYTAKDMMDRLPGENSYSGGVPGSRRDAKVAAWLNQLQDRLIRREEQQVAEAIQTGKLVIAGSGVSYTVDFQMAGTHIITYSNTDLWSSTADKLAQFETWAQLIRTAGAPGATDIILGTDAAALLLKDTNFRAEMLTTSGMNNIQMNIVNDDAGESTFLGTLRRPGLSVNLYTYQGQYTSEAGVATPYIDPKKVVMLSRNMRSEMHYGPIYNLLHGTMVAEKFPFMYQDENGKNGHVVLESSPLYGMHQPDSIVCAKVIS